MFSAASSLFARHRYLLGVVLLFAAVGLAAGWQGLVSSSVAVGSAEPGDEVAAADQPVPADRLVECEGQWAGHPLALPNPGQSHQGQLPPVRLAVAFGDSAWNAVAADVGSAVVITEQLVGAGTAARHTRLLWGSLQVQEVRLQI